MQLLVALSNGMQQQGLKGFTEAEAHTVWTWARKTRVENAMLELALAGLMTIAIRKDGELIFKAVPDATASTTE